MMEGSASSRPAPNVPHSSGPVLASCKGINPKLEEGNFKNPKPCHQELVCRFVGFVS